jgi:hypothetical protein
LGRTSAIGMNFDVSAVQRKCLNPCYINDLRLEFFFDAVENSFVNPSTKTLIDRVPFAKVFGQGSPATAVFVDVLQGSKKSEILNDYITSLPRQQMFDTPVLFLCQFHKER